MFFSPDPAELAAIPANQLQLFAHEVEGLSAYATTVAATTLAYQGVRGSRMAR